MTENQENGKNEAPEEMVENKSSEEEKLTESTEQESEKVSSEDVSKSEDSSSSEKAEVVSEKKKAREKVAAKKKTAAQDGIWNAKTRVGKKVKSGEITDIDQILDEGEGILESEIIDYLIPNCESDLLLTGQSKGKFGGGAKRVFRQTQKKTREGNKPQFATFSIVGNKGGYIGLGYGKAKETVPAREKAIRNAKSNIIKIRRGCGSWDCNCSNPHSIPYKVTAKVGSVEITLMPAPVGKGLIIEKECMKILELAGIKDVWSKTKGLTKTKGNLILACFEALKKLMKFKLDEELIRKNNVVEGKIEQAKDDTEFFDELENKAAEAME